METETETKDQFEVINTSELGMFQVKPDSESEETLLSASSNEFNLLNTIKLLYILFPIYCDYSFETTISKSKLTNKINLTNFCKIVNEELKEYVESKLITKYLILLSKFNEDNTNIRYINNLTKLLKKHIIEETVGIDKKVLTHFYIFYTNEFEEKSFDYLVNSVKFTKDKLIINFVESIEFEESEELDNYKEYEDKLHNLSITVFGTKNPSLNMQKKLQASDVESYKAWRKEKNALANLAKYNFTYTWESKGLDIENVSVARKLLKELGLPDCISKGFLGKVKPAYTGKWLYYTNDSVQLTQTPAKDVIMNPDFKPGEKGKQWYFSHIPEFGNGDRKLVYTLEHTSEASDTKFAKVQLALDSLEDARIQISKDLTSSLITTRFASLAVRLIDMTACRIGNLESARRPLKEFPGYGIQTIMIKHISVNEDYIKLRFPTVKGRGEKFLNEKITDPSTIKSIKKFMIGKSNKDWLFSKNPGDESPMSASFIRDYCKLLGISNPHIFRAIWTNKIFSEGLIKYRGKATAISNFNKLVQSAADKLVHSVSANINGYLSPTLINKFMEINGLVESDMPKTVQTLFNNIKLGKQVKEDF